MDFFGFNGKTRRRIARGFALLEPRVSQVNRAAGTRRFPARCIAAASLLALLCACVPIPYSLEPGFRGSRSDLGEGVPAFIAAGQTTRAEILRKMGPPEVEALDSSWFYYESDYLEHSSGLVYITGGAGWALPVGATGSEARLHRRLLVRFDVGSSRVDLQACKLEYSIVSPK